MEQLNKVRLYERDAWSQFKEIAQVLNDIKASELYYKMDTSWRNIKDVYHYLQKDFSTYFQELATKLGTEIDRVKKVVNALKEKGIDLKHHTEILQTMRQERAEECRLPEEETTENGKSAKIGEKQSF